MDRELLKHCLVFHGESLLNKVKCEQKENPDFQAVISDLCKASYERYVTNKTCRPSHFFCILYKEGESRFVLPDFDPLL